MSSDNVFVRTTKGQMRPWDRNAIINQLVKETKALEEFSEIEGITREEATKIAEEVERRINFKTHSVISSPLVREITNQILMEKSQDARLSDSNREKYSAWRRVCSRVGIPVYDAYLIDLGDPNSFEKNENANVQGSPETSHKKKADALSKGQYLSMLPPKLSDKHLSGDLHIHDLEYFGVRGFCVDYDLRYFLYSGFIPDGTGQRCAVAGPAMKPEVAALHAVKVLAAGQVNSAGGQGFMNFLTFLAPYIRGLDYKKVRQICQLIQYEFSQTQIARGGQIVFSSYQLTPGVSKIWRDRPVVYKGKIWNNETYGDYEGEVQLFYRALMDELLHGDSRRRPYSFPKPEIAIEPEFMTSEYDDLYALTGELTAKYGLPYFDNMLPEYRNHGEGIGCFQCCIKPDELVISENKNGIYLTKVGDLEKNDKILTPIGFKHFENMLERDFDGNLLHIRFEGGHFIEATADHEFPVFRDLKYLRLKASDLQIGDEISVCANLPQNGDVPKYPNSKLEGREYALKLSYFLGLFAAEGSSGRGNVKRKDGEYSSWYLNLCFNSKERNLIERSKSLIIGLFDKHPREFPTNHGAGTQINFSGNDLCEWFIDNGFAIKGKDMVVPPYLFSADDEYKWAFLQGYYRGDGCLRRNGKETGISRLEMNTISKPLAQGVVLLLTSMGIDVHYTEYKYKDGVRSNKHTITINQREHIKNFFGNVKKQYKTTKKIRKIHEVPYKGKVFDPINVEGHDFVIGLGLVIGNCAYQFGASPETDSDFEAKMNFEEGKHFSMGSWQVVTLNNPRAAYRANGDDELLFENLKSLMDSAVDVFAIKRKWMNKILKANRIPFLAHQAMGPDGKRLPSVVDFESLVYTIGVVGINEMVQYHTGEQLHESKAARKLAIRSLLEMKQYARELEQKHGITLAVARTPAESVSQRFPVADLLHYPEQSRAVIKGDLNRALSCIGSTNDLPIYYSNGPHCSVNAPITLPEKIKLEEAYFPILDGGNIFHLFLGESNPDPQALTELIMKISKNTQIGYFSATKDMTMCMNCNDISMGLRDICPTCGSKNIDWLSRVTGYLQAVSGWGAGKKQELKDRMRYQI